MANDPLIRTFLALPLAGFLPEIKKYLDFLQNQPTQIKWVRPEQVHITLHFFGPTSAEMLTKIKNSIAPLIKKLAPFQLGLKGIGFFPDSHRPRVVWIGLKGDSEKLEILQSNIERELKKTGFPLEGRAFKAHATLGRINNPQAAKDLQFSDFPETALKKFDGIILYRSHLNSHDQQPKYEILETFIFKK